MIPLLTGIDRDHGLRSGLTGYLAAVSAAVGVGEESCTVDLDAPASAYIALDVRLLRYPGRDTALLWDERHGWAFAVEARSGEDLLVLAYLGGELVPGPARPVCAASSRRSGRRVARRVRPYRRTCAVTAASCSSACAVIAGFPVPVPDGVILCPLWRRRAGRPPRPRCWSGR